MGLAPRRSVPQHGTIRQNTHYRNKKLTTTFSTLSKFTWRQEKNGVEYRKRTLREKSAQWRRVDYRQWPSRMLSIYGRHWTGQVATATFLIKGLRSIFLMMHGMDVRDKAKQTVSTRKNKLLFRNVPANTVTSKETNHSGRRKEPD